MSDLAPLLEGFFTDRLMRQRHASQHTIAAYRDTFRLLLDFACTRSKRHAAKLDVADLDPVTIAEFLQSLENVRGNSVLTRNARLAAIHSFFNYAALRAPEHAALIQRVLSIPPKRSDHMVVSFLNRQETDALIAAPTRTTWLGRRDHALLLLALETGLRVSELISLTRHDVHLGVGPYVRCTGKGRKERCTPLTRPAVNTLHAWLAERTSQDTAPLFPTHRGTRLSRDAVAHLVARHATTAALACPSIAAKNVTPHTLRHSTAMALLHAGVDISVISMWLGHESTGATQIYLHADMSLKERALARIEPSSEGAVSRYKAPDELLAFLDAL